MARTQRHVNEPTRRSWVPRERNQPSAVIGGARRVTTGRNGDDGRGAFFRFLPATSTHRYALTSNPFPASALTQRGNGAVAPAGASATLALTSALAASASAASSASRSTRCGSSAASSSVAPPLPWTCMKLHRQCIEMIDVLVPQRQRQQSCRQSHPARTPEPGASPCRPPAGVEPGLERVDHLPFDLRRWRLRLRHGGLASRRVHRLPARVRTAADRSSSRSAPPRTRPPGAWRRHSRKAPSAASGTEAGLVATASTSEAARN